MKILKESKSKVEWWVGLTIKCNCGFEGELESEDSIDLQKMRLYAGAIDYTCDCGRLIYVDGSDTPTTVIGIEMTDSGYGTRKPVEIQL